MRIPVLALALLGASLAASGAQQPGRYVCLLDPEVSSPTPGACLVCGFDMIPEELARSGFASFRCPDHPEVQQSRPGVCPKCGRKLVIEDLRKKPALTYVCPMHPVVTSPFPGKCSRCGMELVREDLLEKKSAAYRCPMHPEVVSGKPGKCPRCAMALVAVDPEELARFPTELTVKPAAFGAGQPVELRFAVQNPVTGERVKEFDVVHDKRFHLFVVSQDLEYFDHIHPEQLPDGRWSIETRLPRPGYYRLFADFLPTGGTPQLVQKTLVSRDCPTDLYSSVARLAPDAATPKTVGTLRVTLRPDPAGFIAGREANLTYALADARTGEPVTDLSPYLGAWGHTFVLSEDGSESIHSHPTEQVPGGAAAAAARNKPELSFQAFFPKPGLYRAWSQFLRGQELSTVVFTIEVKRLR
jgi:hypothetical protein